MYIDPDKFGKYSFKKLETSHNIAEMLSEEELTLIGLDVCQGYTNDLDSRAEWEKTIEQGLKLAQQVAEAKTFPWPNASNVKFPLITIAALQYHSRAYPALVPGTDIVRSRVIGPDATGELKERARRIGEHMSYQLLEEDQGWEDGMDQVLLAGPILGTIIKKVYFDPVRGHNVSMTIYPQDFVVDYYTKTIETAARATHRMHMSKNDLHERHKRGVYLDVTQTRPVVPQQQKLDYAKDRSQGSHPGAYDQTTPYEVLEQHTWYDLDGDGYAEPYIVTVRSDTRKVARIVARWMPDKVVFNGKGEIVAITPEKYFVKFPFIPSPDGGFYDLGFARLLGPMNDSINTLINQLIDAGTMANTGGGFLGRGTRIKGGDYTFKPFEWRPVDSPGDDLRKNIVPLPVKEPNGVLLQLLDLLINYGQRVTGATDIMSGENMGQNTKSGTAQLMVEQGSKVMSGVFKRTYRSLKDEFRMLYRLNQLFLDENTAFASLTTGQNKVIGPNDYTQPSSTLFPVADPSVTSEQQRVQQAQVVREASMQDPGFNKYEATKRWLEALRIPNVEQVYPDPKGPNAMPPPPPNPKLVIEQGKLQDKEKQRQADAKMLMAQLMADGSKNEAMAKNYEAQAVKALAEAVGVGDGHKIAMIEAQLGAMKQAREGYTGMLKLMHDMKQAEKEDSNAESNSAGVQPVEKRPGDASSPGGA